MTGPTTRSPRERIALVLRAIVAAGVAAVLILSLYHRLRPAADGISIWLFPFVPVASLAGPAALLMLLAEAVVTLKREPRKRRLLPDVGLVAAFLVVWWAFL